MNTEDYRGLQGLQGHASQALLPAPLLAESVVATLPESWSQICQCETTAMIDAERFKLLYGPYLPPKCRIGDKLPCEYRGREVKVKRITDAPIQVKKSPCPAPIQTKQSPVSWASLESA